MKRLLWIVAVIGLLVVCIGWVVHVRTVADEAKVTYTYVKPERRDIHQAVVINGTITPILSTEIRSEVSGRISKVLVQAGDEVASGQPLIELDQSTLQVQIDEARLGIAAARLRTERSELEFKRLQSLADKALVSEKSRKEAEIDFHLAQNDTASQEARVRLLENSVSKSVIVAPYAGRITFIAPAAGKSAGGDSASMGGRGGGGGGTRDFPIQISIEKSHPRVRPGMTARVSIETAAAMQALSVEHTAVFNDYETGDWFVFVRPAKAKAEPVKTKVELGVRDNHHVEIKSGLAAGTEVSLQRPPAVKFSQDK